MTGAVPVRKARKCQWCRMALDGPAIREGSTGYDRRGRYYHERCLQHEIDRRILRVWPTFSALTSRDFSELREWMYMRREWQLVLVMPPVPGRGRGRPAKAPEGAFPEA